MNKEVKTILLDAGISDEAFFQSYQFILMTDDDDNFKSFFERNTISSGDMMNNSHIKIVAKHFERTENFVRQLINRNISPNQIYISYLAQTFDKNLMAQFGELNQLIRSNVSLNELLLNKDVQQYLSSLKTSEAEKDNIEYLFWDKKFPDNNIPRLKNHAEEYFIQKQILGSYREFISKYITSIPFDHVSAIRKENNIDDGNTQIRVFENIKLDKLFNSLTLDQINEQINIFKVDVNVSRGKIWSIIAKVNIDIINGTFKPNIISRKSPELLGAKYSQLLQMPKFKLLELAKKFNLGMKLDRQPNDEKIIATILTEAVSPATIEKFKHMSPEKLFFETTYDDLKNAAIASSFSEGKDKKIDVFLSTRQDLVEYFGTFKKSKPNEPQSILKPHSIDLFFKMSFENLKKFFADLEISQKLSNEQIATEIISKHLFAMSPAVFNDYVKQFGSNIITTLLKADKIKVDQKSAKNIVAQLKNAPDMVWGYLATYGIFSTDENIEDQVNLKILNPKSNEIKTIDDISLFIRSLSRPGLLDYLNRCEKHCLRTQLSVYRMNILQNIIERAKKSSSLYMLFLNVFAQVPDMVAVVNSTPENFKSTLSSFSHRLDKSDMNKILNNKKHIDRQIELGYILQKKRADEFISFDEAQFSKFVSESGLQKTDVDDIENEEDLINKKTLFLTYFEGNANKTYFMSRFCY